MTERTTAIVLFTDLVGSTELRSRLGEDTADALRHQHDALVAGAVEATRGKVMKNLGDGIMATFAGATDAVEAAVAVQQAIGRHNRSGAASLQVRIGISAGDVVFEESDCFGTPVIEAARLCAAAAGGQILASEMVRWLARSSPGEFVPVGSLELKGLAEPVPAVEVRWSMPPQSSVPLPTFLTDIGRIFVGRDTELDRLGWSRLEPYADQLIMVGYGGGVSGNVAFYLGLLATTVGDWAEAEARFAAAEATHERIGAPTWLARTRLEWGRMLRSRCGPGDGERAERLLRLALDVARERRLPNIERDAGALLSGG